MGLFLQKCFLATKERKVVGFACYDVSAKGFFDPIGVDPEMRGKGIGKALLLKTLEAIKYEGYGYAIIGGVSSAFPFCQNCVNAHVISSGEPQNSVYSNLIMME